MTGANSKSPKSPTASDDRHHHMRIRRSIKKSLEGNKLPFCPKGATVEYTNQGPCQKQKERKKKRRAAYRIPLKKEDGNLEAQVIEYNCEFPNRVVVRLEYLMQSTKVRLNDRQFMDEFYEKLLEEENRVLKKATRAREKAELTRMKRLIIDGINKKIPDELSYLNSHPVFRVNQMLSRLSNFENEMFQTKIGDDQELTPVEPYEYDGNKFFVHLHETGTLWAPDEQRKHDKEKLQGKVYRAKLRLLYRREQQMMEDKILRLMNDPHHSTLYVTEDSDEGDSDDTTEIKDPRLAREHKRNKLANKIQTRCREKQALLDEKIRESKQRELEREADLDVKRRELEELFVETVNYDTLNVIHQYDKRERRKTVEEILENDRLEVLKSKAALKGKMKPYERVFAKKSETLKGPTAQKYGGTLYDQLRRVYRIPGSFQAHLYDPYDNEIVQDVLGDVEDVDELIENGDDLTLMYDRQYLTVEDYVKNNPQLRTRKPSGFSSNTENTGFTEMTEEYGEE